MSNDSNIVTTRDFIPVGIFSAIMIAIRVVVEIIGAAGPAVWIFMPVFNAVLLAPVYMLMISKVPRVGAVAVNGILMAIWSFLFMGTWIGLENQDLCSCFLCLVFSWIHWSLCHLHRSGPGLSGSNG